MLVKMLYPKIDTYTIAFPVALWKAMSETVLSVTDAVQ